MTKARAEIREIIDLPDIVVRPGGAAAAAAVAAGGGAVSKEEAAAREMAAAASRLFTEADAAVAAGNVDGAIQLVTKAVSQYPTCQPCYMKLAEVNLKKPDLAAAEAAYLKAAEIDPKSPAPYDGLLNVYNQQKKFEQAGQMATKASELRAASGAGDATSSFNTGIVLVNQGKMAEARPHFERATELDPRMAEAYYHLGMAYANEGKMAEARKALEQYLTLAPNGPNAAVAKAVLPELK
jgi:superkiller protein 3